jgi:hypothetical protein
LEQCEKIGTGQGLIGPAIMRPSGFANANFRFRPFNNIRGQSRGRGTPRWGPPRWPNSAPQSNTNFPTPLRGRGFVPFGPRMPNANNYAGNSQNWTSNGNAKRMNTYGVNGTPQQQFGENRQNAANAEANVQCSKCGKRGHYAHECFPKR